MTVLHGGINGRCEQAGEWIFQVRAACGRIVKLSETRRDTTKVTCEECRAALVKHLEQTFCTHEHQIHVDDGLSACADCGAAI